MGLILCDEELPVKFGQENKLIPSHVNKDCISTGAKGKMHLQKRANHNVHLNRIVGLNSFSGYKWRQSWQNSTYPFFDNFVF